MPRCVRGLSRESFRLFEWYPRRSGEPFSEVRLRPLGSDHVLRDEGVIALDDDAAHALRRDGRIVRFADPQWTPWSEDQLAGLIGEPAIRELRSFAGLKKDYVPERLYGQTGTEHVEKLRSHNKTIADALEAQVKEWT